MKKLLPSLTILTFLTIFTILPTKADFGDLPQSNYYYKAFKYLEQKGIVKGYDDHTVRPDKLINRAELIKMVVEGLHLAVVIPTKPCFTDVKMSDWYIADLCAAKDRGIVAGLANGTFEPNRNVNKAEALKIMVKITKLPTTMGKSKFTDIHDGDWYTPFVIAAETGNFLEEKGPIFDPNANYTRGQIGEILYRILVTQEQGKTVFVNDMAPTPISSDDAKMLQWQLFALDEINRIRNENGVGPVKLNSILSNIAAIHSQDMGLNIKKMSHDGSLGEQAYQREKAGKVPDVINHTFITVPFPDNIDRAGENVGMRNLQNFGGSAEKAIQSQHTFFMNEPTDVINHRTIMLSSIIPFTEVGIGLYLDKDGNLWITEDYISTK